MNIPSSVKIGGVVYAVEETTETLCVKNRECVGTIDYENAVIRINNKRGTQRQAQTFWHEVVHGIFFDRGIDLGDEEESIVEALGIS